MNFKNFLTIVVILAAFFIGWFLPRQPHESATKERKIRFYQSAMHPWIKSDTPGRCTICGMELTPVYEGENGLDAAAPDTVSLTQNQIQVTRVQTATAAVQPLLRTLPVAGIMDDDESRHRILSAYVEGRVEKLFANHHGAEVIAGQPLALIYSPTLLQAEREYRTLTGDLQAKTALRLRQMGLTETQIAALPSKPVDALTSEILAPLSGTVVTHSVYEGQYVMLGQPMFEIADFSVMWFQFRAYEQDLPWIKLGQTVVVTTPSQPGKTFSGRVTFIDPNFNEATRSTSVRVELPNPMVEGRREILHRLYADGSVLVETPDVLSIPRSALLAAGPEAVAYVDLGGGNYRRTVLKTGRRGDTLVEVIAGLQAGDLVVTNGNLLIDGQAEINRSFASPTPSMTAPALSEAAQQALAAFLPVADAMAAALAQDNLAAYTKASQPATDKAQAVVSALPASPERAALAAASHLETAADLEAARLQFHKFTVAATALLEPLRRASGMPPLAVWECFMVNQIIAGAPPKGHWLQLPGRPGQNPFFGHSMLDCAKEIRP